MPWDRLSSGCLAAASVIAAFAVGMQLEHRLVSSWEASIVTSAAEPVIPL
jgi:hypothetical protein